MGLLAYTKDSQLYNLSDRRFLLNTHHAAIGLNFVGKATIKHTANARRDSLFPYKPDNSPSRLPSLTAWHRGAIIAAM
ncbi:hypothetical protein A1342_06280 [Methylomonas methanica]|uniref:Uncharacterized protein n=1 Tax=Methylomonas denitrificans TaxID=1538553 RepID=A0A126T8K8_9GAMM|nr:hypothetical protein JT25_018355 [Methylomonas denitrificans]OAI04133.1 hypothetical protein A1342_06280 [Methylomonas methanica]